jgi:hypothetical protein
VHVYNPYLYEAAQVTAPGKVTGVWAISEGRNTAACWMIQTNRKHLN